MASLQFLKFTTCQKRVASNLLTAPLSNIASTLCKWSKTDSRKKQTGMESKWGKGS